VGLYISKGEPRLDVVCSGHVVPREEEVVLRPQLVDHHCLNQEEGGGEEGGARHDALNAPPLPLCISVAYDTKKRRPTAYAMGFHQPRAPAATYGMKLREVRS
jgi:hypothetical protein